MVTKCCWITTLLLATLVGSVCSRRIRYGSADGSAAQELPPEVVEQLTQLLSEDNLPQLVAQLPEEYRPMVEQYAPILRTSPGPVLETLMNEVPQHQQGKILKLVDKVSKVEPSGASEVLNDIVQEVVPVLQEKIQEPEFLNKIVKDVVEAGALEDGGLEAVLKSVIPPEMQGIMAPLLKFLSLDGTPILNNLDGLSIRGSGQEKLMDGPLRTLFLLMNILAYSTSFGNAGGWIGATGDEKTKGYDVVDSSMTTKTSVKWWVPKSIIQVFDIICGVLKLELSSLSMMQDYLVSPEVAAEDPMVKDPAALHVVVATFQSKVDPKRKVTVHTARTGVGAGESSFGINDFYLLMGLYESPIRKSVGLMGLKYFSLANYIYKGAQGIASWDWLMKQLGKDEDPMVQSVAGFDEKRKAMREQLADHIQSFTKAVVSSSEAEQDTVHVYTGISLGGSIARMMAMRSKLQCERCQVVALTVNAPNVHGIVQKIGLTSDEESKLEKKKYLFGAFVNFVAQHDVIWKLDKALPGSSTCMYVHAAETAGCRGVTNIGKLYSALKEARSVCASKYRTLEATEEQSQPCILEEMAPVLQCIAQEHAFVLRSGVKDMWRKAQEDMSLLLGDVFEAFSNMRIAPGYGGKHVDWIKASTGKTITVSLSSEEQRQLQAKRRTTYDRIDSELRDVQQQIEEEYVVKNRDLDAEWEKLPSCTGCTEDWCADGDIRKHRCCATDDNDVCKNPPQSRTKCRGSDLGETCSGVDRFLKNQGRRCACVTGYCWDGSGCSQDDHVAKRQELTALRKGLAKQKGLWLQLRSFEAARKKEEFEASVVKKVESSMIPFVSNSTTDAKPDPAADKSWICAM